MLESPGPKEVVLSDERALDTRPSFIERTLPRGEQRGPTAQSVSVKPSQITGDAG
jgi:hypothetical protein